ncbi:MAG TPA: dockerin type I repeat-containing protein [Planctomycetota bacterium]|nr:dockerin type I repeat-containing protein [Planctomycetota bacterium]
MQKLALVWMVGISLSASSVLNAQDPPEKERIVCDIADPKSKCPGANCLCVDDVFEITFDGLTDSVFEFDPFVADMPVNTVVVIDAKSSKANEAPPPDTIGTVQGWSYGVDHDDAFLTLTAVTQTGTEAETAEFGVLDMMDIETCANDPDPKCPNPQPAAKYFQAVILSFRLPRVLEVKRNMVAKADYTLKANPGPDGTLIQFVDYLKKAKSPPVDINITVDGKSRVVTKVIDGWVKAAGEPCVSTPEDLATAGSCTDGLDNDCDGLIDAADPGCAAPCVPTPEDLATAGSCTDGLDNDCDELIDAADPGCQAPQTCVDYALYFGPAVTNAPLAIGAGPSYVVTMRNVAAALGFQLGVRTTTAGGTTTWEFSGALGADANRLIELIITDDAGNSQTPAAGNTATSSEPTVGNIMRGSAIAGFSADDFFEFDLAPGVGGTGFTVGYVADLTPAAGGGNKIPATGTGDPCPVNEILRVSVGPVDGVRFSRGDANGDSKINVTDAVLIIQNIVGNLAKRFACDDILDANDDGVLNVTDALPVLAYVFQRGPDLPAPFRTCGVDPTNDALTCTQSNCQ